MDIKRNYPLLNFTTFRIGGPADYFVSVESVDELSDALDFARDQKLAVFVLGRGSNVLISDQGLRGLVIHNQIKGLEIEDSGRVIVGAGENWDDVVAAVVNKNLGGIECLSGVPGSAGGSLVQNIGAYGQTLADVVSKVHTMEVATGEVIRFTPSECGFEYRGSIFKRHPNKYIVTKVELDLEPNAKPILSYAHVKKQFENKPLPTLAELREFIIKIRASKGYLIMPGYESFATAGSFFKNPVVDQKRFEQLKPILGSTDLNRYWDVTGGVKIAAAFLMQEAGFGKGYHEGNVGISPKHSLSLTNFGGAHAAEIKALAKKIEAAVFKKFKVKLEEEVLFMGHID